MDKCTCGMMPSGICCARSETLLDNTGTHLKEILYGEKCPEVSRKMEEWEMLQEQHAKKQKEMKEQQEINRLRGIRW